MGKGNHNYQLAFPVGAELRFSTLNSQFHDVEYEAGCDEAAIDSMKDITLARELWDRVPEHLLQSFADTVISHCRAVCQPAAPSCRLDILLIDDNGNIWQQRKSGE